MNGREEIVMRARNGRRFMRTIIGVLAGCALAATVLAQGATPPGATAVERGRATFRQHCAVCHGDHGKGNGPAASALRPRPRDLSTLGRRQGGFSAAGVEATIKGTAPVTAHGSPTMQMWGAFFTADANGNQAEADRRIADVVAFIESIQAK